MAVKSRLFIAILEKSLFLPFLGDFGSFLGLNCAKRYHRLHIHLKYLLIHDLIKKYFPTRYDMATYQKSSILGIFGDFGHFLGIFKFIFKRPRNGSNINSKVLNNPVHQYQCFLVLFVVVLTPRFVCLFLVCEHLTTNVTTIQFATCVYTKMFGQGALVTKRLPTMFTHVMFLPCVSQLVIFQITPICEGFITHIATTRLDTCVHAKVCGQMILPTKVFPTNIAFLRFQCE